jgi:heptosyltransferase-2
MCFKKKHGERNSNFLIIRLDAIGDMILFSPFVRELRRQQPNAKITLIISPVVKNLYKDCPYVDEILYFDGRKKIKPQIITSTLRALMWGTKNLSRNIFDTVMLPRQGTDTEGALMLAITSRAKKIISFSEKQTLEKAVCNKRYDKFFTTKIKTNSVTHEVEANLNFLRQAGFGNINSDELEIWFSEDMREKTRVDDICGKKKIIDEDLLIAIGFSATQRHRCWPTKNFKELFKLIEKNYPNAKIILIGGPGDEDQAIKLREYANNITSLVGELSLKETALILKKCTIYIGNDSGPMHIAAAVKTPVIEISYFPKNGDKGHGNSPVRFGPWQNKSIILQPEKALPPCIEKCLSNNAHCITQITEQQVFTALKNLIEELETSNN